MVSEYDLLAKSGATARDVMTTAVVSVTEDTSIDDVRNLLVGQRIGRVPVLSGGRLVGIISPREIESNDEVSCRRVKSRRRSCAVTTLTIDQLRRTADGRPPMPT
jgi:predicted transcriptional regulator